MYALTIQRNVDYVVYKTKGVFKVEKRAVWSMNLKDNREENNAESSQKKFEFCMQRQIVGIGWFPNENFDADPAFCNAKKCLSSFKRGDLVFFDTVKDNDLCDHVGIYLGSNKFIHASSTQGKVVISTLSGVYADTFSWGRRLI